MSSNGKTQEVIVGIELPGQGIVAAGVLKVKRDVRSSRDCSTGQFRYARSYLQRSDAVPIDPLHMPLTERELLFGRFGGLPGALRDAAPDNWGRMLIERHLKHKGFNQPIAEVDYLIYSPSDRAGNLHFALDFDRESKPRWNAKALDPSAIDEVRLLTSYAMQALASTHNAAPPPVRQYPQEVAALLTGMGGSRPKASVKTSDGMVLLKMANPFTDQTPNARLEAASLQMAHCVGIPTAKFQSEQATNTIAIKRFDIEPCGRRMQMVSAMTVLDANDAPYDRTNWSYPLLARELDRWSAQPQEDKAILFKCMVLRAMLSDGDDHPRNYALIRDTRQNGAHSLGQWRLSPMYDCVAGMGKGIKATDLAMDIGKFGSRISEENILSQCNHFGLSRQEASAIMLEIQRAVLQQFPQILTQNGVDPEAVMKAVAPLDERPIESAIARMMQSMAARDVDPVRQTPRS